jgi:hypothetical protein
VDTRPQTARNAKGSCTVVMGIATKGQHRLKQEVQSLWPEGS